MIIFFDYYSSTNYLLVASNIYENCNRRRVDKILLVLKNKVGYDEKS